MLKKKIVALIKKSPFLYNLAKKFLNKKDKNFSYKLMDNDVYYVYIMQEKEELEKIKQHYDKMKNANSKLAIVINDKYAYNYMHKLIRENMSISFIDLQYFKLYNKKIMFNKCIMLDYKNNQYNEEILEYVI